VRTRPLLTSTRIGAEPRRSPPLRPGSDFFPAEYLAHAKAQRLHAERRVALVCQQAAADATKAATAKAAATHAASDATKAAAVDAAAALAAADAAEAAAATAAAGQAAADAAKAAAATAAATMTSAATDGGEGVALTPAAANVDDTLDFSEPPDDQELLGISLVNPIGGHGLHGGAQTCLQHCRLNGRRDGGGRRDGLCAGESCCEDAFDKLCSPPPPRYSARSSARASSAMKTTRAASEQVSRTTSMFKNVDPALRRAAATCPASAAPFASPVGTAGDGHMSTATKRASSMATAPAALSAAAWTVVDDARNWDADLAAADQDLYDALAEGDEEKEENRRDDTLYLGAPPPSYPLRQRFRACVTGRRPLPPPRGAARSCATSKASVDVRFCRGHGHGQGCCLLLGLILIVPCAVVCPFQGLINLPQLCPIKYIQHQQFLD